MAQLAIFCFKRQLYCFGNRGWTLFIRFLETLVAPNAVHFIKFSFALGLSKGSSLLGAARRGYIPTRRVGTRDVSVLYLVISFPRAAW